MNTGQSVDVEQAVRERYSQGAKEVQPGLCCPSTTYDARFLEVIPQEIIEKDYGCGDPTAWCEVGQTVMDLGSGGGKACYIISQRVGPKGRVIGIDMNDDMLALARKYKAEISAKIGYDNVTFHKARIQDLALDMEAVDAWLTAHPVRNSVDLDRFHQFAQEISRREPVIPDDTVDLIVSNCVLNLVQPEDKSRLFREMHRVLRKGGRAVISDITSDEDIPLSMIEDEELWSGCISGAYREDLFLKAFVDAGFQGIEILGYDSEPWQTVQGIEFRSMTVSAFKGPEGPCREQNQAVIYKGPYREVLDDDDHRFPRGVRIAVCGRTFGRMKQEPYGDDFVFVDPREPVEEAGARMFDCSRVMPRHARETKGLDYDLTTGASDSCCGPDQCC